MHTFLVILLSQDKRTILQSNLYISKSWSVTIIIATLLLSYTSGYVTILFYFFGFLSLLIFYCKINFFGVKCDAIHVIFFPSFYIYIYTHTIHFATQSLSHIIHFFFISSFIFQNFLLTIIYRKTKTKTSSPYYGYISSNLSLPSLLLYLPHYSLLHHYNSFILFPFL